jgi:hypothetical protein
MARKPRDQYPRAFCDARNYGNQMGIRLICASAVGLLAVAAVGAERVQLRPEWQRNRVALDRCFVREEFRIYYALEGGQALSTADQQDRDGDGVPDKIQSIALQLLAARRCYVEV